MWMHRITNPREWPLKYWRTAALGLGVLAVAACFAVLGSIAFTNHKAIEKSCILLNNKILDSQQQAQDPRSPTYYLIQTIFEQMPSERQRKYLDAVDNYPAGQLQPDNCRKIANEPDSIRARPKLIPRTPLGPESPKEKP